MVKSVKTSKRKVRLLTLSLISSLGMLVLGLSIISFRLADEDNPNNHPLRILLVSWTLLLLALFLLIKHQKKMKSKRQEEETRQHSHHWTYPLKENKKRLGKN
ncbi:flagellar basal body-associated protein FliL [Streptococcus loxodontisalivarius]|uniref:Flagellar basal body-associated protein FliL n=1 Tax=Streptococcus loxodontisalivarius TaxID=1349415 RepID=A0ABS2PWT9_9STRE|nr:flagellar basal body-associated protein FliL [Streptococcus loxodontisalivarius]